MVNETADIAIVSELEQRFADFTVTLPYAEVAALEQEVEGLVIEDDAGYQHAATLGSQIASWTTKAEGFWEGWREHYFRRYKAIMAVTKDGITTVDQEGNPVHQLIGTAQLAIIRKKIEHAMRTYKLQRKQAGYARQSTANRVVTELKTTLEDQVTALMLQGRIAEARQLQHEAANIHPVALIRDEVKLDGAGVREPYKWSVIEDGGLMQVIKAIASGACPLYHDIQVKGKPDRRPIVDLSSVVLNYKTRELGPDLHIPGIAVERDVNFAFAKTGTKG